MASKKRYKTEEAYLAANEKDRIRNLKYGRRPEVKARRKIYRDEYYQKNKEKINKRHRNSRLKWAYGITQEEWNLLFESQNKRCAICQDDSPKEELFNVKRNPWHTDHIHGIKPTKIRGILCNSCNKALGLFKDNPEILRAAANYIEKYNA